MQVIKNWDLQILTKLNHYFAQHDNFWVRFFAEYLIYGLPLILLGVWFWSKESKKVALRAIFSVILAWPIFALIIGKIVNRPRPFNISGVQELVFHRPDYSFPSDHAATLFAVALSFWLSGYKVLSIIMFIIAIVISFFRVATAIHYPSDVLAGAALGLLAAYLIYLFDKPLSIVYNFIIKTASIIKLA